MKNLKFFLTITCTSFTLVVMLNALLIYFHLSELNFTIENILEIFIICVLIAGVSISMGSIPYVRDHLFMSCYFAMVLIAIAGEYFLTQQFYWSSVFIEIFFLSLVYLGVWFCLYTGDERCAKLINEEIKKRNQK